MTADEGPGVARPLAHFAWQLREQGRICAFMGSPFYATLLDAAAADVEAEGPTWRILRRHVAPGRGNALALRFMAAVHRLVLTGRAGDLARYYPSVGGDGDGASSIKPFLNLLEEQAAVLAALTARPCQTNEVGRSAALVWGLLSAVSRFDRPLRLLEVGSSAGLNLRLDHFRYGDGRVSFGPGDSPVDLNGLWREAPPTTPAALRVISRQGCDPHPLDPSTEEDRLSLKASVWADQLPRLERLEGAFALAARVPATVDRASAADWLPDRLSEASGGCLRLVFHSIVDEYFDPATRHTVHRALAAAGDVATLEDPLAWVRLEPVTDHREHGLWITLWPGDETHLLALCGAHGQNVRRASLPQAR